MNEIEGALSHTAGNPQSDEMKKSLPFKTKHRRWFIY